MGSCAQCAVGYYKNDTNTGPRSRSFETPPRPTGKGAQPLPKRLCALGSRTQRRAAPVRVSPDRCTVCGNCGDGERRTACGGINGDDSDPVLADTATATLNPHEALPRPAWSKACRQRRPVLAHAPCHCQARASAGQCTACDAGKYKAGDNTEDCSFCPAGKFSLGNATECTECAMPPNADDHKCVDSSLRAPPSARPLPRRPPGRPPLGAAHAPLAVRQTLPRSLEPHAVSPPSTRRRATVCLPSASLTLTLAPNPNPNPNPGPTPTWAAHLDQHHPCRTSSPVARAARLCRGRTPAQPKGARRIPALNPNPSPANPSAQP